MPEQARANLICKDLKEQLSEETILKQMGRQIFAILMLGLCFLIVNNFVHDAKSLILDFNDENWSDLKVSGPDLVKPGETQSYLVSGTLGRVGLESIHVKFWLDTSSQTQKVVLEADPLVSGIYNTGYELNATYQIFIPTDAINNSYMHVKLDTATKHFYSAVSLVQKPTYVEIQSQNSNLQSQLNSITALAIASSVVALVLLGTTIYFAVRKPKAAPKT